MYHTYIELVHSLRDFQISDEDILVKVMEKYNLSKENAQAYLN